MGISSESAGNVHSLNFSTIQASCPAGESLSAAAMVLAAAGYIAPTVGALIQEAIDVSVILNALRSARDPA